MRRYPLTLLLASLASEGCGGGSSAARCTVGSDAGCSAGEVCEVLSGSSDGVCSEPLVIRGRLSAFADGSPVAGARLLVRDTSGAVLTPVAESAADGTFEIELPNPRNDDGTIVSQTIALRAEAHGFVPYPYRIHLATPIATGDAVDASGKLVVQSADTDIVMFPVTGETFGGTISGQVDIPSSPVGVLVVAENGFPGGGVSTYADATGAYEILDVQDGVGWQVQAYAQGVNYDPAQVTLSANEQRTGVDLHTNASATRSVTGTLQIAGSGTTSVILLPLSTFDTNFQTNAVQGEYLPGLRAPAPPSGPTLPAGTFTIDGVPDGYFVALFAFEDDGLVREQPGSVMANVVFVNGANVDAGVLHARTALQIVSPGADGVETITGNPTFTWVAFPGANAGYQIDLFDVYGRYLWQNTPVPAGTTSLAYDGSTTLQSGMLYLWQIRALDNTPAILSSSEDLRGIFYEQ